MIYKNYYNQYLISLLMQKQSKLSYIVSRLTKHHSKFSAQQLKMVNKVLKVQPSKENITDIIKIIDAEYEKKCEQLKANFSKKGFRQPGNEVKFDLVYRDDKKQQWVQYLDALEIKGVNYERNAKLSPAETSRYLQTLLQISEKKSQTLSQGLIKLLQALAEFEEISIEKSKQKQDSSKSSLNRSSISESVNQAENDSQVLEEVEESKIETTSTIKNQAGHFKRKGKQQYFVEVELAKESKTSEQIKKYQAQIADLNARISSLQAQAHRFKEQNQKNRQLWQQSQENYNSAQSQINRLTMQIKKYSNDKKQLQQQKQNLKTLLSDYKLQLAHFNQSEYYNKQEIRTKQQLITRMQTFINGGDNQQKQLLLDLGKQNQAIQKHVAALQAMVGKKEEEVNLHKLRIQQLTKQIKEGQGAANQNQEARIRQLEQELAKSKEQNIYLVNRWSKQLEQKQRLNRVISQLTEEKQQLNQMYQSALKQSQNNHCQLLNQKRKVIKHSEKDNERRQDYQKKLHARISQECQKFQQIKEHFQRLYTQLKSQNKAKQADLQKVTSICQNLLKEKRQLQQQLSQQTANKLAIKQLLNSSLVRIKQHISKANTEKSKLQAQIAQLKSINLTLDANNLRLSQDLKSLASKNKEYENKFSIQSAKIQQLQLKLKSVQQQLDSVNAQLRKQMDLGVGYKNQKEIVQREVRECYYKINELNQKIANFKPEKVSIPMLDSSVLTVSQILSAQTTKRQILIGFIESFTGAYLAKSQLKYKHDEYSLNFGQYLNKAPFPLLLLLKLAHNDHTIGVFSTNLGTANSPTAANTFMFSLQNEGRVFKKMQRGFDNGASFTDNMLIFGNNQLYLKNNSSDKTFKLNIRVIGSQYFNVPSAQSLLGYTNESNQVPFKEMEIHRLYY